MYYQNRETMGDAIITTVTYLILIIFMIGFGVIMTIGLYNFINQELLGNKPKKNSNKEYKTSNVRYRNYRSNNTKFLN